MPSQVKKIHQEVTRSIDQEYRLLSRPGLRSVRIVIRFDSDGNPTSVMIMPEFQRSLVNDSQQE